MNEIIKFEPATKQQTWALFSCYKKDLRPLNLSKKEASKLITDYNNGIKELPLEYQKKFDALKGIKKDIFSTKIETNLVKKQTPKKSTKQDFFEYMTSSEVSTDLIINTLGAELKIGSVITNDVDKSDKKAYLFLGSGCGFAHLSWDKRNKKVGAIISEINDIRDKIEKHYISLIDKDYIKKLEKMGSPIQAILSQNLSYNTAYNYKIIRYLNNLGFKNITTSSMLD